MKQQFSYTFKKGKNGYTLFLEGDFNVTVLSSFLQKADTLLQTEVVCIDCKNLYRIDTACALYLQKILQKHPTIILENVSSKIEQTLDLVQGSHKHIVSFSSSEGFLEKIGKKTVELYTFFIEILSFIGMLFIKKLSLFFQPKNFRIKEILYEINQSAIKALFIVALTSFLVGIVIAYQSAVQLKMYGANIFIVDMLGISILRELAPMLTAIVIAGRSGSAYTAEIGAMKITEELDAMRTMGFDPYYFLVIPRIIALSIALPILIFVADIAGIFGGMLIAHSQLDISFGLFVDRFVNNVDIKHFVIGIIKGPFFAFLITIIAIFRGFMVKDDTQSIGKNTTKSVVESIFAVIICDAVFSIIFTNLGL